MLQYRQQRRMNGDCLSSAVWKDSRDDGSEEERLFRMLWLLQRNAIMECRRDSLPDQATRHPALRGPGKESLYRFLVQEKLRSSESHRRIGVNSSLSMREVVVKGRAVGVARRGLQIAPDAEDFWRHPEDTKSRHDEVLSIDSSIDQFISSLDLALPQRHGD